jgi:hypothetical protein
MVTVVAHPETGEIIKVKDNPDYGTIRVDSEQKVFSNGFFNIQKRSAFIRGEIENLKLLNLKEGSRMKGQIIKEESFNPFFEGQDPKINPNTAEVVLTNGMPTYLNYVFTDDLNATDRWVDNNPEQSAEESQPSAEAQPQAESTPAESATA